AEAFELRGQNVVPEGNVFRLWVCGECHLLLLGVQGRWAGPFRRPRRFAAEGVLLYPSTNISERRIDPPVLFRAVPRLGVRQSTGQSRTAQKRSILISGGPNVGQKQTPARKHPGIAGHVDGNAGQRAF
ncbi:MAG: hypothetical protein JJT81_11055, partial [Rubellimicrobium sp.]|nr:hypothetical protein [Rubellimicrobium sp.]